MARWSPTPMPSAPPDEPSPITIQINGLLSRDITARFCAIASLIPRSSESIPGYARACQSA